MKTKHKGEKSHSKKHDVEHHEGKHHDGVHAHKKGMKAKGKMAAPRADKKSRGGKTMTPKSPMSGADPTKMRSGFATGTPDKSDD